MPNRQVVMLSLGTGSQATPVVDLESDLGLMDWFPGMLVVTSLGQASLAGHNAMRMMRDKQNSQDIHYLRLRSCPIITSRI